jgi:oxygen-independent coproporphyrinogen III oxidase
MELTSAYIHIPFCVKRCQYCDFNTVAGINFMIPAYVKALCREIKAVGQSAQDKIPIHTIYFGGGTPSLLDLEQINVILATLKQYYLLVPDAEISLEANPGTLSPEFLRGLHDCGVNRLSLGMQSACQSELDLLGRIHSVEDVADSISWARAGGFSNINLDLMYGIPGQTLESWKISLEYALSLQPEHLSLYGLTLDEDVPLMKSILAGKIPPLDDDLMADMYELADEFLGLHKIEPYEISNWCQQPSEKDNFACKHNLQYWRYLPYLGFGAGAHGFADGQRTENVRGVKDFIARCGEETAVHFPAGPACENLVRVDLWNQIQESAMVGLRLVKEGISMGAFQKRFGFKFEDLFSREIETLMKIGLLEYCGDLSDSIRLTKRGKLLGNQVFMQFVGKPMPDIVAKEVSRNFY